MEPAPPAFDTTIVVALSGDAARQRRKREEGERVKMRRGNPFTKLTTIQQIHAEELAALRTKHEEELAAFESLSVRPLPTKSCKGTPALWCMLGGVEPFGTVGKDMHGRDWCSMHQQLLETCTWCAARRR
jgi:hypothetical protein